MYSKTITKHKPYKINCKYKPNRKSSWIFYSVCICYIRCLNTQLTLYKPLFVIEKQEKSDTLL